MIDFFLQRRSVTPALMKQGDIKKKDLNLILKAGLRIPDHGALKPWKLVVISGEKRKYFDKEVILKQYKKNNPDASVARLKLESNRIQRAHTVIAVLSTPKDHPKILEWEQVLSAGALCTTLLYSAQSLGYAASWITEWYSYDEQILIELGGSLPRDKIAGFIYIGDRIREPKDRLRPAEAEHISYL